jgi:hypothetical protein
VPAETANACPPQRFSTRGIDRSSTLGVRCGYRQRNQPGDTR